MDKNLRLLEALLFASQKPISEKKLIDRLPNDADISKLLSILEDIYDGHGINLVQVGSGWAFRTAPELGSQLVLERDVRRKLSRAAVETLSIIAYYQPITRAEIEEIRGVTVSKGTIDVLFEAHWIGPKGRRRTPGRPVTWGTTEQFLDHFGISRLDDLPGVDELKAAGLLTKKPAIQNLGTFSDNSLEEELNFVDEDESKLTIQSLDSGAVD
ncbi:MAG: SMC-Scp complex subunit ScpB [Rhodospirillaceae bacterium]|nr:SMC-Scp complex subunit ScpB [Rhodospirillaceae bacterium]|tara:strand:+ start:256 stop:894 length:639 start_codon:yes stop_codon:yes gene_type:complete